MHHSPPCPPAHRRIKIGFPQNSAKTQIRSYAKLKESTQTLKLLMVFSSDFFGQDPDSKDLNPLLQYLQTQSPEVLSRVAKSASPEIKELISHNVQGLLGMLPSESFNVQIVTNRDNLAGLLASAMMTGYFLRQMEQRMELEETVMGSAFQDK